MVLRVSAGDTLVVNFTNLLTAAANPNPPLPEEANAALLPINDQVADRKAGFHVQGLQLVSGIANDASMLDNNPDQPGDTLRRHDDLSVLWPRRKAPSW